jgi:hypothetical protein
MSQMTGVKIEGAEVKVRGPLTSAQFNSLISSLSTTQLREVNIRGLTADQVAALDAALKNQTGLREVNIRDVTLTQAQFNSLVSDLQALGVREAKIKATVAGQPVEARIEDNMVKVENEAEPEGEEAAEAEDEGVAAGTGGATMGGPTPAGGTTAGSGTATGSSTSSMMMSGSGSSMP